MEETPRVDNPHRQIDKSRLIPNYLSPTHLIYRLPYLWASYKLDARNLHQHKSQVFTQLLLATWKQEDGESIEHYHTEQWTLSEDYSFKATNAKEARYKYTIDVFLWMASC